MVAPPKIAGSTGITIESDTRIIPAHANGGATRRIPHCRWPLIGLLSPTEGA
jgi:hypothetical protein